MSASPVSLRLHEGRAGVILLLLYPWSLGWHLAQWGLVVCGVKVPQMGCRSRLPVTQPLVMLLRGQEQSVEDSEEGEGD